MRNAETSTSPLISLEKESALSLAQAAALIPPSRGSRSCHLSTILRWVERGVLAPNGQRVRLRAARVGGRWLTSKEALSEFMAALTPKLGEVDTTVSPRTPNQHRKSAEHAGVQLSEIGI